MMSPIDDTVWSILSKTASKYYFKRQDYQAPLQRFFKRIGWRGIVREGISHSNYLFGSKKAFVLPRLVRFEVTNLCNLKCKMCPQPRMMKREKRHMDLKLFKTVLSNNPQIQEIDLFNWGEPLLHPKLEDFINHASGRKIYTRLVTNGVLLNQKRSRILLESGLNEIIFSLDNVHSEYQKIRGVPFEIAYANITAFVKAAKEQSYSIRTGINIVESPLNQKDIAKIIETLKRIGVDSILVEKCQFQDNRYERRSKCFEIYRNICILSNGEVVPCCVDFDGVLSVGSVYSEPNLKHIFNNPSYVKLRQSFSNKRRLHKICQRCQYRTVAL